MDELSFQEQGSVRYCHGCGADNRRGLQIKSYWDGAEAVSTWKAEAHHCGGSKDILNGGIIASLIDCHSLNLAIADAYRAEGRPIGSQPRIGFVTANINISYLKPTPINEPVELRARISKREGRKVWVHCTLSAAGEIRVTGEVLGVRVDRDEL
ncbi:MAG TPA: PaaI family thioesterase [Candidatus Binatia bacterium]|nr:PaaI family thioesterase [Candidatus Binatia bacterium]